MAKTWGEIVKKYWQDGNNFGYELANKFSERQNLVGLKWQKKELVGKNILEYGQKIIGGRVVNSFGSVMAKETLMVGW